MSEITLNFLQEERKDCKIELQRISESLLEQLDYKNGDKNSHGTCMEIDISTNKKLLERQQNLLYAWNEAITRHRKGIYGVCVKCHENIPKERLQVRPFTGFCVPCLIKN